MYKVSISSFSGSEEEYCMIYYSSRLKKSCMSVCLSIFKNECYRLVLFKSLMMLNAGTSCFDFSRLRSQFQFLDLRRETKDRQDDREVSDIKYCRKKNVKRI